MNAQRPPAGWYDDPAGSGGIRFWNGRQWTDQLRQAPDSVARSPAVSSPAPPAQPDRERLPDGFMMLNGQRVPIGQLSAPPDQPERRGARILVWLIVAIVFAAALALLAAREGADEFELGRSAQHIGQVVADDLL